MKIINKGSAIILILLVAFGAIGGTLYIKWQQFLKTDLLLKNQTIHYMLTQGDTIRSIANTLEKKGNLKHPTYLVWYAKLTGVSKELKAGEYNFVGPLTPRLLLKELTEGNVIQHEITFVEGLTINDIIKELQETPNIKHEIPKLSKNELLLKLGIKHNHLEGLFFPNTYKYIYGSSDLSILKRAHAAMLKRLNYDWQHREKGLPYKSAYQALIVASMIEKETGLGSEQPIVSGVIVNRLRKRMYLQIDPTVIYGLGNTFNGKITLADLRAKTPYNTYVNKGLPPTPICLPGQSAIYAAMHPAKTDYLYFVSKGDGSHVFSTTLKAHDQHIRTYILKEPHSKHIKKQAKHHANKSS